MRFSRKCFHFIHFHYGNISIQCFFVVYVIIVFSNFTFVNYYFVLISIFS